MKEKYRCENCQRKIDISDDATRVDEGVIGMKVGGVRKLTVPPHLGYGENGAGGVIPPNATLVFEIELLELSE